MTSLSDDEIDFDDPRFLIDTPKPAQELTYAEKRRKTVAKSREAGQQRDPNRSRKQLEEETREEGLRRNLIASDTLGEATAGESKALKMMKGMGFKPGEGLGRKRSLPPDDPIDNGVAPPHASSSSGGLGFHRPTPSASTSASAIPPVEQPPLQKARTEPITFELREKRTGLGIPQAKRARPFPSSSLPPSSTAPDPEATSAYLTSVKSTVDARRAYGYLRSLRRTCEELDRRHGVEENVMWRDLDEEVKAAHGERRRRAFLRGDADFDEELGVDVADERKREDERKGEGELGYAKGLSGTVVDDPEEEGESAEAEQAKAEEAEWFAFDVPTRLGLMLAYLRREYAYCFWCGAQYDSAEDLKENCPGEAEEDH